MTNLLSIILIIFVAVLGFGAVWAITMNGSAAPVVQDSFGTVPSPAQNQSSDQAADLAVHGNDMMPAAFFLSLLVAIAVAFVWLARTGPVQSSKY